LSGRSKYKCRSKSPREFVNVRWRFGKEGNYKKKHISKTLERGKGHKYVPSTKENTSIEGGDVYLTYSITHVYHEALNVD
jgi:hypothetical protein